MKSGLILCSLSLLASIACGNSHSTTSPTEPVVDEVAPTPYTRVGGSDTEVAKSALAILKGSCESCHSMSRTTLTSWRELTDAFEHDCISGDADVAECITAHNPASFSPESLGIFAAATKLPWLQYVTAHSASLAGLDAQAGMPRSGVPLAQDQFDTVHEWFARGLAGVDALIPLDEGGNCASHIDPELLTRIAAMKTSGWRAQNEQTPLLMLGCESGQVGKSCLTKFTNAASTSYGSTWSVAGATVRILRDNSSTPSTYWTRSSADGKFMGSGARGFDEDGFNGLFVNIETGHVTHAKFDYDASFFPDNSGFLVQRGGYDDGSDFAPTDGSVSAQAVAVVCEQNVLTGDPEKLSGTEPACSLINGKVGLYQQLSRSISGSDYWAVHGSYQSDNNGFSSAFTDPVAAFPESAKVTLTRMLNTGTSFSTANAVNVPTPHMGDPVSSPSGELISMRIAGAESTDAHGNVRARQAGYAIYSIDSATAQIKEQANICKSGGKATFSYDERWLVFHHYVDGNDAKELGFTGANDPDFSDYQSEGSSNVYLVDLKTGVTSRITNMKPGQYALFPHFRSDGWIQFVVRTTDDDEWFASSDAALVRE